MGGGSADCAATLVLLNRLWRLDLEPWRLAAVAARLGSDVPFFLHGGLALGLGRGDEVMPLQDLERLEVVVVAPEVVVATAEVYGALEPQLTWRSPDARLAAFAAGLATDPLWDRMRNDLEAVVCRLWPEVAAVRDAVTAMEGLRSGVTGSGSAAFAVMRDPAAAKRASRDLARPEWRVERARTLAREESRLVVQPMSWEDAT